MGEKRGCIALESWCRTVTTGYKDVNITNMTSSWKNGLAFCALIHHFRPDLIDFSSLSAENVFYNNQLAFTVAEQHLGIPALLDAEDMVEYSAPDRLSILTYVSQFYQVLVGSKGGSPVKRPAASVGPVSPNRESTSTATASGTPAKLLARQLLPESSASPRTRRAPDLCATCKNPVFLAERLMVNGRLHHRVCFRCARCKSQLSVANYYETENDQYCCETCPDEVSALQQPAADEIKTKPSPEDSSDGIPIAKQTLSGQDGSSESQQQPERLPSIQEKRFLDSMFGGGNDSVVVVEVQQVSSPVDEIPPSLDGGEEVRESVNSRDDSSLSANDGLECQKDETTVRHELQVGQVEEEGNEKKVDDDPELDAPQQDAIPSTQAEPALNSVNDSIPPTDDVVEEASSSGMDEEVLANDPEQVANVDISRGTEQLLPSEIEEECGGLPKTASLPEVTTEKEVEVVTECSSLEKATDPDVPVAEETPPAVPKPRQRKGKKSDGQYESSKVSPENLREVDYPEELNPFEEDADLEGDPAESKNPSSVSSAASSKVVLAAPKISLNPFGSDDEDEEGNNNSDPGSSAAKVPPGRPPPPSVIKSPQLSSSVNVTPSPKKRAAPAPPPAKPQRTPSMASSGGGEAPSTTLRRKAAPAPPPPSLESPVPAPRSVSLQPSPSPQPKPRLLSVNSPPLPPLPRPSEKEHKDMSNLHLQSSTNKDSHGQWKRKKGPAPPRPLPQKRQLRKLPLKVIQQELEDIEVKQLELERQGVALEENIRALTEPEDGSEPVAVGGSIHVEEMILQLFDLVNEKNELLRRQTELMYVRRQQRLEEEHAELEFQIRVLMDLPDGKKTDEDRLREEELINRLVDVVHRRAQIVDCLEMDRRRQEEEDQSIQQHLDVFNSRGAVNPQDVTPPKTKSKGLKMIQSPLKIKKKDKKDKQPKKSKKGSKVDDDKDVDETDIGDSSAVASAMPHSKQPKEKEKSKAKSWFNK